MTAKQYISLIVAVIVLGAAAYFSQKEFLQGRILSEPLRGAALETAGSATPASRVVAIIAEDKKYEIDAQGGMSAYEAMRAASASGFTFSGREYPSLGFFVESINGKKSADGFYWILYVNGKSADKGASQTYIKPGDMIEWRYESR